MLWHELRNCVDGHVEAFLRLQPADPSDDDIAVGETVLAARLLRHVVDAAEPPVIDSVQHDGDVLRLGTGSTSADRIVVETAMRNGNRASRNRSIG